ncbi:flagella-associated protein [Holotrichia oblita]|uniref:Flagella-associated protein n=2 Tax=Holotrichia oblita TaxID=644536 RepID=A0ACB9T5Z4_HOLOL|nr:flagella-associated protein [Holotrichia oblita]KAI4462216.1 flagella-associated protein [Holotrichia oblita]
MSSALTATPQIEADKRLIQFKTYEDYLNSLVAKGDHCYLQSTAIARQLAELGYRSSGETLTREQFETRVAAVIEYLYPTFKPYVLASYGISMEDPFHKEMALRERPNRLGILAVSHIKITFIFRRVELSNGCQI